MKMYEEETREVVDYREKWGILKDASEELQEEIVCLKVKIGKAILNLKDSVNLQIKNKIKIQNFV